jgi:hypothetical protein
VATPADAFFVSHDLRALQRICTWPDRQSDYIQTEHLEKPGTKGASK